MKENSLKTLIITCLVVLFVCFIIKIFGGNWFELGTENTKFIQFCNFVDNNMWLKMILACIFQLASGYLLISVILNKKRLSLFYSILFSILLITRSLLSWYIEWITLIFDILVLLVIPMLMTKKIIRPIVCFLLLNAFQIISLVIRNISLGNFNENSFMFQTILQIDYYIMLMLYYLYNFKHKIKKGVKKDGSI